MVEVGGRETVRGLSVLIAVLVLLLLGSAGAWWLMGHDHAAWTRVQPYSVGIGGTLALIAVTAACLRPVFSDVMRVFGPILAMLAMGSIVAAAVAGWESVLGWLNRFSTGAALGGTLAAAGALIAVVAAHRKLELDREVLNHERTKTQADQERTARVDDRSHVKDLRERYTNAAQQLASDQPAIALAGVYAMSALAKDWQTRPDGRDDTQSCLDVLHSILTTPPT